MEKGIKKADAVPSKLEPALTRTTNHRLEVARENSWKREEIVRRRKTNGMVVKRQRAKERICLSSEEKGNYESDIGDEMDSNQANDKYSLQP